MSDAIRVLHVDDDPEFAEMVARLLEREHESITVVTETHPRDGLETLRAESVDCVVSDYHMPETDGLEFLDSVRDRYPDLPFILFTGHGSEEIASEAISHGVTEYMQKQSGTDQCAILASRIDSAVSRYRAEETDEETRGCFQTLVEESTDAILVVDPDGMIQYATPPIERLAGRTPEELVGTNGLDPVHPDDVDRIRDEFVDLAEQPELRASVEFRYHRPDGASVWAEARGRNLLAHPRIEGIVAYIRDITERKQLELNLSEEQRLMQNILDSMDDIFYVFDENGQLDRWNEQLCAVTGYSDAEIAALDPKAFIPPEQHDAVPGVSTTVGDFDDQHVELAIVTKDGERIPHEFRGVTVVDEERGTTYRGGIARDISDRKERERALREETAFNEAALDSVVDFYWVIDLDGYVTRWSDTDGSVTGYTSEEAIGMHTSNFHPDDHFARIRETITEIEETGSATVEADLLTKGGDRIPYRFTGTTLTDDEGTVEAICGSGQDISERKQREAELERQNTRLERLASVLSHDLRNPLNVASGHLDLAREACERGRSHHDAIEHAHRRMNQIIDDVLTLSRNEGLVEEPDQIRLDNLVSTCWQNVQTAGATLRIEGSGTFYGDQGRVRQLFENLFRNAVEHGGDDVTIRVGALADGFFLEDDGPGIPPDDRERVFEYGYSTSAEGTGLGLAIVEQVVADHGWAIAVMASQTGGARFEITDVDITR